MTWRFVFAKKCQMELSLFWTWENIVWIEIYNLSYLFCSFGPSSSKQLSFGFQTYLMKLVINIVINEQWSKLIYLLLQKNSSYIKSCWLKIVVSITDVWESFSNLFWLKHKNTFVTNLYMLWIRIIKSHTTKLVDFFSLVQH